MRRGFGERRGILGGLFRGRGPMRPGIPRHPLAHYAQQQLMRANQLIAASQPLEAAAIFASVSALAELNGMPARGANLSARAALACFDGGDLDTGKSFALKAVRDSLAFGAIPQAVRIAQQAIAQLRARDLMPE